MPPQFKRKDIFDSNFADVMSHVDKTSGELRLDHKTRKGRALKDWIKRQFDRKISSKDEVEKIEVLRKLYGGVVMSRVEKEEADWYRHFEDMKKYKKEAHTIMVQKKTKAIGRYTHGRTIRKSSRRKESCYQNAKSYWLQSVLCFHNLKTLNLLMDGRTGLPNNKMKIGTKPMISSLALRRNMTTVTLPITMRIILSWQGGFRYSVTLIGTIQLIFRERKDWMTLDLFGFFLSEVWKVASSQYTMFQGRIGYNRIKHSQWMIVRRLAVCV
jgi:hypothetical protein